MGMIPDQDLGRDGEEKGRDGKEKAGHDSGSGFGSGWKREVLGMIPDLDSGRDGSRSIIFSVGPIIYNYYYSIDDDDDGDFRFGSDHIA